MLQPSNAAETLAQIKALARVATRAHAVDGKSGQGLPPWGAKSRGGTRSARPRGPLPGRAVRRRRGRSAPRREAPPRPHRGRWPRPPPMPWSERRGTTRRCGGGRAVKNPRARGKETAGIGCLGF